MQYKLPNVVLDHEIYVNYAQFGFKNLKTGNIVQLECFEDTPLDWKKLHEIVTKTRTCGFNSNNYDIPITFLAIKLARAGMPPKDICRRLKLASQEIIEGGMRPWEFRDAYNLRWNIDHVDIMEVAPGQASLKIYGGRVHSKKMQDLPYHHTEVINEEKRQNLLTYNVNDLGTTQDLLNALSKQLTLRCQLSQQYGMDLRSKSDAQIAEAVVNSEIKKLTGNKPSKPQARAGTAFYYQIPDFLSFTGDEMNDVLDTIRDTAFVTGKGGKVDLPDALKGRTIRIGDGAYRMGIGGLHSSEESTAHVIGDDEVLIDRDVTSYYPRIIINQGLFPKHLGKLFLRVYEGIVNRRIKAKNEGDSVVAKTLKIVINGLFGKFGSPFSTVYSPHLLIQTTVTGQLALLMLIEMMEDAGIKVVSANTDGVVMRCHKGIEATLNEVVAEWERRTQFETEETRYQAIYSRDVNNYIAVFEEYNEDEGGWTKQKGVFATNSLQKNPANAIAVKALVENLVHGTSIRKTILEADDIRDFVTIRQVKGGGVKRWASNHVPPHDSEEELLIDQGWEQVEVQQKRATVVKWQHPNSPKPDETFTLAKAYKETLEVCRMSGRDEYLGKAVRWIYCTDSFGPIMYQDSGNTVARSENAYPVMELPDSLPPNIDRQWYINEALDLRKQVGADNIKGELDLLIESVI